MIKFLLCVLFSVPQESFGLAVAVCFMGAPVIINEKLASGTETELCLKTLQNILATGKYLIYL